jgi:hypothetical protein
VRSPAPPESKVLYLAVEIEAEIFDRSDGEARFHSLFNSMADPQRAEKLLFAVRLLNGTLTPQGFAALEGEDLITVEQRLRIEREREQGMSATVIPKPPVSATTMFRCRKCKQPFVSYVQQQVLCADEPMTVFCECATCGHRWRE